MRENFGWVELELGQGQKEKEAAAALGCALPAALSPDVSMSWRVTNPKSLAVPQHQALPLPKLLHREEVGWYSTSEFHTGSIPDSSCGVNTPLAQRKLKSNSQNLCVSKLSTEVMIL